MEDRYRRLFEAMPCYLTVQDRDYRITDANRRFRTDFGDFEGRYCYQVYKHRSEKCEVCPVEQAFWDGQCHRSEERVKCLNGKEVSVLVEATPIRNGNGEVEAVMEMSTDVTQIKRLETQLRQSRERYRILFEEVPCYISIQDPDLHIVETNRSFRESFGDALGRKCYEAYKHRSEECVPCPVRRTLEDDQPHTREEVVTSVQGEHKNVLVTTAPIHNSKGQTTGVMEMSADITLVRELESRLTSLGLLIGSVSHGLKGLLNGLTGGVYLVDTGFSKNKQDRVTQGWEIVKRNVTRIKSMVSDILYYAKDRTPNWETVCAADVAEEALRLVTGRAEELNVQLSSTLLRADTQHEADAQAIRALLTNLLDNSIDACRLDRKKSEHKVALRLTPQPEHVQFEVEDNGVGMDRETREKAFSLFFSSKGMEGTGLGLFIANRIAEAHGGTINLESEVGKGTRFVVRLPRARPRCEPDD
ncbi:PAS domain-containing protein, partial [Planctomycetota bacterium]